ncbi:carboxypeptidase-like regulatory domain-containing protein [Flavobacterium sp. PLA-1-15]|uniref:carboxypeptidase-like regulatory domain-containing protein n=1 Tax=Flavobacterium sp. PLA-1-15 TaxID=3380533 RepID=UPI003B796ED6
MKKLQERKLSMYIVVEKGLQGVDDEIVQLIPRYKFYHESLINHIENIKTAREKQEKNITGTAKVKATCREKVIESALEVAVKVRAYAIDEDIQVLEQEVKYSKTKLEDSADTVLRDRCQIIHDTAKKELQHLKPYGVTAPMLDNLQKDIYSFVQLIPEPRLKITTKKDATDELSILFLNTDKQLRKMDKVFEMVRETHKNFYRNYKNNRIVINPGSHLSSVLGNVKDEKGNPIQNVIITEPTTGLNIKTGAKGTFRIKKMEPGNYEFTFAKNGFELKKAKVAINPKEATRVHLVLQEL